MTEGPTPNADGSLGVKPGSVVLFEFQNRTAGVGGLALRAIPPGTLLAAIVEEAKVGVPASYDAVLGASLVAPGGSTSTALVMIEALVVPGCYEFDSTDIPGDFPVMVLTPEVTQ